MSTITPHTTRAEGTILTAAIYNADHVNHVTNTQNLNTDKMEGATPPVVDGHGVLWDGTTGAALKTAGFAPANVARAINTQANSGLTGGGNLSADRNLAADFSDQSTAEAGSSLVKVMSPGRVEQWFNHANTKASQAEAEAGADDTKWVSPLKLNNWFDHANQKASSAEALAGTDDTKWISPAKLALVGSLSPADAATSFSTTGIDTGVVGASGGLFAIVLTNSNTSQNRIIQLSANGGTNYSNILTVPIADAVGGSSVGVALVSVKGAKATAVVMTRTYVSGEPSIGFSIAAISLTGGAGNVFIKADAAPASASFARM